LIREKITICSKQNPKPHHEGGAIDCLLIEKNCFNQDFVLLLGRAATIIIKITNGPNN